MFASSVVLVLELLCCVQSACTAVDEGLLRTSSAGVAFDAVLFTVHATVADFVVVAIAVVAVAVVAVAVGGLAVLVAEAVVVAAVDGYVRWLW